MNPARGSIVTTLKSRQDPCPDNGPTALKETGFEAAIAAWPLENIKSDASVLQCGSVKIEEK